MCCCQSKQIDRSTDVRLRGEQNLLTLTVIPFLTPYNYITDLTFGLQALYVAARGAKLMVPGHLPVVLLIPGSGISPSLIG